VGIDCVSQDGFLGGVQAAAHAISGGHQRIGVLAAEPLSSDLQVLERFAGIRAGFDRAGRELDPDLCVRAPLGDRAESLRRAKRLLERKDRPTAILALWQAMVSALATAARALDLTVGKDFEMVGWSTEEGYRTSFMANFREEEVPPAITWSLAEMARAAMRCIRHRRAEPGMPPVSLRIPTALRLPDSKSS
jgi:DNA-binding LacI/PurR family transcriptional regulator